MTSRRPKTSRCPKTMKRRPCWCPKPVLWELNSFLMQTLSFVPINLHRWWSREWKHSIENVFRVCKTWNKHERVWENSRQLCKPETKSRVCITVKNSHNASSIYIRLCKHRKKVFYCFYKKNFLRKNAKLFVWYWLKEEFLPVAKSCPRGICTLKQFLFCKKMLSKIRTFLA